jgi:predicted MPP superfamily phosphohydrolase/multisubunit Na+/H+ antiporter MnhF subunit
MNGLWVVSVVAHAYVALRLLPGVLAASGAVPAAMLAVLLVLSAGLVPLALRRRRGKRTPEEIRRSDMLAWASLTLMGLFSSLFVLTLLRDVAVIVLLLARLAGLRVTDHWLDLSASGVVVAALLVTLAGFYNARKAPRVKTVDIPLKDLPPALQGFKIAQISDMHIGPTIKRPAMKYVVARINQLQVDVVAITGDLVDGNVYELSRHVAPLAGLRSSHGTFFVTGNHEYYSGVHPWLKYLPSLGVRVLLNEHVIILHKHAPIVIAGVTDFSAASYDTSHRTDVALAITGAPRAAVKVLLAHQPRSAAAAEQAGFDLQLSGHTHGGQFLPWNFFVRFQQPFTAGLHRVKDMLVYVSRGTGYWGPPKRFGSPSEITLLRLVAQTERRR